MAAKFVPILILGTAMQPLAQIASAQQRQIWDDEVTIVFRGASISIGTSERDFDQKCPGGVKVSVGAHFYEVGALPTVFSGGAWKLLAPKLTAEEVFIPSGKISQGQDFGSFYFQDGKLVALEIYRLDLDEEGNIAWDLTPDIFKRLRSFAAEGRSCSIIGFNTQDREGDNQSQIVRVSCGQHYLTMTRNLSVEHNKPTLGYGLDEGLIDETAKVVALPQAQN